MAAGVIGVFAIAFGAWALTSTESGRKVGRMLLEQLELESARRLEQRRRQLEQEQLERLTREQLARRRDLPN